MPLVALAVAAYAAGLLLGFGGAFVPSGVLALTIAAAAALRRSAIPVALAAVGLAGTFVATAAKQSAASCRSRAITAHTLDVILDADAAPGAWLQGSAQLPGCTVAVSLAVARGVGRAGDGVLVHGEIVPTGRGIMIKGAVLGAAEPRSSLRAIRAEAGARIDSIFRGDAPLARALLIADMATIEPAMRDRFATAGIIHMLSISGLHVAIIAAALGMLFRALRLSPAAASMATIATTALYVAAIGAPAPAVRSGMMLGVGAASTLLQRPTSPWATLALGALAPLVQPRTVLDLGYQLSIIGMAGLMASGALARRWIAPRLAGWRREIATVALASVVAAMVSAPLVCWTFGRLSLIAPLTNVVATPIIALAQPALFLALLLSPSLRCARFVADAIHPVLAAFAGVAVTGASVPYAALAVSPTLAGATLCALASAAVVTACVSRHPARPLLVAAGALSLAAWMPFVPSSRGGLEMHMIDVGQGDAIALRTPHGRWILVDAGRIWRGGDAGRSVVVPYLRRLGGDVAAFVLTHPHADHVGGAATVMRALRPSEYWDGGYVAGIGAYDASLVAAAESGVRWRHVHPGDSLAIDGVVIRVLAPDSAWSTTLADPNAASVTLLVTYGAVRFLLVGDAERDAEAWLLEHAAGELQADILKVGHHGSNTSTSAPFLAAVHPRVALVSVGAANDYGHPSRSVMRALAAEGADVLRTDQLGSVVVRTDGHFVEIEARGERWTVSRTSSAP